MLLRFRWPLAALTLSLVLVLVMPAPAKASACDLLNQLGACTPSETGEWPGGIAPPGSLRTRREGLPSPGSHRPTSGLRDQVPVGEERGLMLSHSVQPVPGPKRLAA